MSQQSLWLRVLECRHCLVAVFKWLWNSKQTVIVSGVMDDPNLDVQNFSLLLCRNTILVTTNLMFKTRGTTGVVFWCKASIAWGCLLSAALSYAMRRDYVTFLLGFNGVVLSLIVRIFSPPEITQRGSTMVVRLSVFMFRYLFTFVCRRWLNCGILFSALTAIRQFER